eukprot:scaffold5271_cov71-Isochrysis_galbana.AAC.1
MPVGASRRLWPTGWRCGRRRRTGGARCSGRGWRQGEHPPEGREHVLALDVAVEGGDKGWVWGFNGGRRGWGRGGWGWVRVRCGGWVRDGGVSERWHRALPTTTPAMRCWWMGKSPVLIERRPWPEKQSMSSTWPNEGLRWGGIVEGRLGGSLLCSARHLRVASTCGKGWEG